tara:strand:+ start:63 stop:386 length:324 start_codon:yes stop_codon:yes gene_type:complete
MKINAEILKQLIKEDLNLEAVLELKFHPTRRWRIDIAIPSLMIAIELEGGVYTKGRHTRPSGFLGDIEKYNNLTILGYKLLRYAHVKHSYNDIITELKEYIDNDKKK